MQEIPHKNTKVPKQHHDKKIVNVKIYQNTKIDISQTKIMEEDESIALEQSKHMSLGM